jgi:hypothetical protein
MSQNSTKEITNATPLLVAIPNNPNTYYNVAPFFGKTHMLGMDENHFEFLTKVVKRCQRVVACANEADVPMDNDDIKLLLFHLFELETIFDKCSIVKA